MSRNALWIVGGLIVVGIFGVQFSQIKSLRKEVASVRAELTGTAAEVQVSKDRPTLIPNASAAPRPASDGTSGFQARLTYLERRVDEFSKGAEVLMDRGMIPPSEEKLAQLQQKFFDPNTSDDERMKLLGLLRRNNQVSDEIAAQSLSMLQNTTNVNFKRALLQNLDGLTNASLKQPLFAMLETEADNDTRAQLVNALRRFTDDPAVESKLWDMALNDPNKAVRDRAREAVTRNAPATPERLDRLSQTTQNPAGNLDERLLAFRALRLAKAHTPEMVNEFAAMAASTTDPLAKAKLFASFNGLTDPNLLSPLVNGLQDADPVVRQKAADALGSFPDPRVAEWMNHLLQNDTDEAVKREAHKALEQIQKSKEVGVVVQ
jgi:HEAT repeat protein